MTSLAVALAALPFFVAVVLGWFLCCFRHPVAGYGVVLFSMLTLLDPLSMTRFGVTVSLVDVLFTVYVFAFLAWVSTRRSVSVPIDRRLLAVVVVFVAVLVGFPIIGLLLGQYSPTVLTAGFRYLQWVLFLPITATLVAETRFDLSLPRVVAIAMIGHAIVTFVNPLTYTWRATGLLPGPNQLGSFVAICTLIAAAYAVQRDDSLLLNLGIVFLGVVLLLLSQSRSGLIMLVTPLPLLALVAALRIEPRWTLFFAASIVAGVALAPVGFLIAPSSVQAIILGSIDRFAELAVLLEGDPTRINTLASRIELWEQALATYRSAGWFGTLVPAIETTVAPHNYYLSVLVQAGPIGFGLVILLFVHAFREGVVAYLVRPSPAALALALVTISIVFGSFTRHPFVDPPIQILFWSLLGIVTAEVRPRDPLGQLSEAGRSEAKRTEVGASPTGFDGNL